jgi:arsenate reductase
MKRTLAILSFLWMFSMTTISTRAELYPEIAKFVEQRTAEFGEIPDERKEKLKQLAVYIQKCDSQGKSAQLTFVCTHNSRRSHFAQVWAQTAASHYGIKNVISFSGGTEATACNPRTIAALKRAGFQADTVSPSDANPHYFLRFQDSGEPITCFSKIYNDAPNPTSGYCAIMTCSQADKACPAAPGCELRVAIPYDDPKLSDGTPKESATYDKRGEQIAREMLYVMSLVHQPNFK